MARTRTDIPLPGTPEAKARRAPQVDLSGLDDLQQQVRDVVIRTGESAFGSRWQSDMAQALGRAPQQVASWVSGKKPVPTAVFFELGPIAHDLADALERRAAAIRAAWPPRSVFEPPAEGALAAARDPEPEAPAAPEPPPPRTLAEQEAYIARNLAELCEDEEPAGPPRG